MAKHIYISKSAASFRFRIEVDNKDVVVKFHEGQFSTEDDNLAKAIDTALNSQGSILMQSIAKVDRAAAEKLVAKHRAANSHSGAVQGGITALMAQQSMQIDTSQRDMELNALANTNGVLSQLAQENDLLITQPVAAPVVSDVTPPTQESARNIKEPPVSDAPALKPLTPKPGK